MKKCSEMFFFPFYELLVQVLDLTTLNRFETLEYLDVIYVVLRRYACIQGFQVCMHAFTTMVLLVVATSKNH